MRINYLISKRIIIKDFLKEKGYSDEILRKIKECIYVNGNKNRLWQEMNNNDKLEIVLPLEESSIIGVKKNIDIIYEDDYLIVVNKEANMASMPNRGHYENSLANYVKYYFMEKNIFSTIHLVNRLDYATRGLVLIAKHQLIHGLLSKTNIKKRYYAVVKGIIKDDGLIDKPIEKDGSIRKIGGSKESITVYHVLKYEDNTLLDVELKTGRTHQIRLHFASINHPVLGDKIYGDGDNLALESYYLEFIHPITNENIKITIPNSLSF